MEGRQTELLDEVRQIISQYRQEVPGRRRAWPESIKKRVLELELMGLERKEISKRTGISYYTIFNWGAASKKERFEKVAVVQARRVLPKTATVTVARHRPAHLPGPAFGTVTVTMPSGIRIEGVSADVLKELLPSLVGGGR